MVGGRWMVEACSLTHHWEKNINSINRLWCFCLENDILPGVPRLLHRATDRKLWYFICIYSSTKPKKADVQQVSLKNYGILATLKLMNTIKRLILTTCKLTFDAIRKRKFVIPNSYIIVFEHWHSVSLQCKTLVLIVHSRETRNNSSKTRRVSRDGGIYNLLFSGTVWYVQLDRNIF